MSEFGGMLLVLVLLAGTCASVYVLDRLKKAERRDESARLEVQEDENE